MQTTHFLIGFLGRKTYLVIRHKNFLQTFYQVACPVDEGKKASVVFLDFSEAFDAVARSTILDKLSSCGVSRSVVHW